MVNCDKLGDFAGLEFEDINLLTGQRERKEISKECELVKHTKDKIQKMPLIAMKSDNIDNY
jgi:hypothetical protein